MSHAIGGSTIARILKTVSVTKALEAAVAYTAKDVLSESDTASEGTDWDFLAIARSNGGKGNIISVLARSETEAITPRLAILLWNVAPTNCELDDNAASTAPNPADTGFQKFIELPAMTAWGDDSVSLATPSTVGNLPLPFECASGADDLYIVVVTLTAFTQTAGENLTIEITAEV